MDQEQIDRIKSNPKFIELCQKRSGLAVKLSVLMLVVYYGYILLLAFNPEFFTQIVSGSYVSIGFPVGVAIIIFAFVLTGIYVKKANTEFDDLTDQIKNEVK